MHGNRAGTIHPIHTLVIFPAGGEHGLHVVKAHSLAPCIRLVGYGHHALQECPKVLIEPEAIAHFNCAGDFAICDAKRHSPFPQRCGQCTVFRTDAQRKAQEIDDAQIVKAFMLSRQDS